MSGDPEKAHGLCCAFLWAICGKVGLSGWLLFGLGMPVVFQSKFCHGTELVRTVVPLWPMVCALPFGRPFVADGWMGWLAPSSVH